MKKQTKQFAVSSTIHLIDYLGLDGTCLKIIEANNAEEAARMMVIEELLEYDLEIIENINKGEDDLDSAKHYGITEAHVKAASPVKERKKYWRKRFKWLDKNCDGYDFIFDNQEGITGSVMGLKVVQIGVTPEMLD